MIIIKKYFRYIGLIGICFLSFYYTEKVALFVRNKNPLMKSINEIKDSKYVNSIDSIIIDNLYIIPGINGKEVNSDASFANMHEDKLYIEDKLVFNEIKPTISLEDNKDKIIIKGNSKKNSVSLIFESISDKTKYMLQNNYKVNILINEVINALDYELINNANKEKNYNIIEYFFNDFKINKELCYVKNEIPPLCRDKYLFKTSRILGTAISAAPVGVGARRSATKSAIVKSTSCPTALIVGIEQLYIALATISSLNAHKSSIDPPPRPTINTSRL